MKKDGRAGRRRTRIGIGATLIAIVAFAVAAMVAIRAPRTMAASQSLVGCSDGTREGFLDTTAYPDIAGCAGGWSIPGVLGFNPGAAPDCPGIATFDTINPACGRLAGNDSNNPNGSGCNVADLCAEGWHVCDSSADVMAHSSTGCDGAAPASTSVFFVTRQSSTGCGVCATGTAIGPQCTPSSCNTGCAQTAAISNDVFGCGNIGAGPSSACAPLNAFSNNECASLPSPWSCNDNSAGLCEAYVVTKSSPAAGGVLCCSDSVSASPTATPTPSVPALYVANSAANSITVYPLNASGDQTPEKSISGGNTGLGKPQGVAVDSGGSIYVTNSGNNSITEYSNSASGNVSPTNTIAGVSTGLNSPEGIALDSSGNIYVAIPSGNSVAEFSSGSTGNASPITTISGAATGLNNPQGVALDTAGNIYVSSYGTANGGSDTVTMYAPGSKGNASPSATIGGASTGLAGPLSIAVDSSGNIYVVNFIASQTESVTIYAPGTTGNLPPSATISGNSTHLENPAGIAVDGGGNLYVTNDGSVNGDADTVTKYAEGQSGNLAPFATLVGADVMLDKPIGIAIGPFFASTPTMTATPTATATATATATSTASATATATRTATGTATATATSTKTATATATATHTATATATSTTMRTPTATPTATATSTATSTRTPRPRKTPKPTPTPVPENLNINPQSNNFGNVKVGHDKSATFTLSNSAQQGPPITFTSPGGFSVPATKPQVFGFAGSATNCPLRLFPKKSCKLTVEFVPASKGFASSTVTIRDNAANANQTIPLSGSGK